MRGAACAEPGSGAPWPRGGVALGLACLDLPILRSLAPAYTASGTATASYSHSSSSRSCSARAALRLLESLLLMVGFGGAPRSL